MTSFPVLCHASSVMYALGSSEDCATLSEVIDNAKHVMSHVMEKIINHATSPLRHEFCKLNFKRRTFQATGENHSGRMPS